MLPSLDACHVERARLDFPALAWGPMDLDFVPTIGDEEEVGVFSVRPRAVLHSASSLGWWCDA